MPKECCCSSSLASMLAWLSITAAGHERRRRNHHQTCLKSLPSIVNARAESCPSHPVMYTLLQPSMPPCPMPATASYRHPGAVIHENKTTTLPMAAHKAYMCTHHQACAHQRLARAMFSKGPQQQGPTLVDQPHSIRVHTTSQHSMPVACCATRARGHARMQALMQMDSTISSMPSCDASCITYPSRPCLRISSTGSEIAQPRQQPCLAAHLLRGCLHNTDMLLVLLVACHLSTAAVLKLGDSCHMHYMAHLWT